MIERVEYDEFGLFHENAAEYGISYDGPPTVRREFVEVGDGRRLSALVWGTDTPELVFVHGGAQNAHTWDTVALALGRPMIAVDLPGHGYSDGPGDHPEGQLSAPGNARDVATVIEALAPQAKCVIGMSLGGMTSIALAGQRPDLVRSLVLVDITPGVNAHKSRAISNFVNGPKTFPSFAEILARTIEHNPTRTEASLRRGILHNALQLEDGSWVWRYRRFDAPNPLDSPPPPPTAAGPQEGADRLETAYSPLWDVIAGYAGPLMLVRGMLPQSVVDDADEDRLRELRPSARVERIVQAGHSVQGDTPIELAALIDDFVAVGGGGDAK